MQKLIVFNGYTRYLLQPRWTILPPLYHSQIDYSDTHAYAPPPFRPSLFAHTALRSVLPGLHGGVGCFLCSVHYTKGLDRALLPKPSNARLRQNNNIGGKYGKDNSKTWKPLHWRRWKNAFHNRKPQRRQQGKQPAFKPSIWSW